MEASRKVGKHLLSHSYALLIGVNDNLVEGLKLPSVAEDIRMMQTVLLNPDLCAYLSENVYLVQGEQATRNGISDGLTWLENKLAADPESTAVLYFSGHGWKDRDQQDYFFIPYDVDTHRLRFSALKAADFALEVNRMNPARLLVLLDCCHAQGMGVKNISDRMEFRPSSLPPSIFIDTKKAVNLSQVERESESSRLKLLEQGCGRAVLSSSKGDQYSYLRADRKMSLFTFHLVEALTGHAAPQSGASEVLVSDVASYVHRSVPESARKMGVQQQPEAVIDGLFPVALLLGGKGLANGATPPDILSEGFIGSGNKPKVNIHLEDRSVRTTGPVTGSTIITGDNNQVESSQ